MRCSTPWLPSSCFSETVTLIDIPWQSELMVQVALYDRIVHAVHAVVLIFQILLATTTFKIHYHTRLIILMYVNCYIIAGFSSLCEISSGLHCMTVS